MDRKQILADLKGWLDDQMIRGDKVSAFEVLDKINQLEEEYE